MSVVVQKSCTTPSGYEIKTKSHLFFLEELHARRTHLLAALSSIPAHFLDLYTHRTRNGLRQCKLGYDSSSACDSFQLGEMVKFLVSKNLLSLTTFSSSYQDERDFAAVDLQSILAAMKQVGTFPF